MRLFLRYIKEKRSLLFYFLSFCLFLLSFLLYHLPIRAILYPFFLCTCLGLVFLGIDFQEKKKKLHLLCSLKDSEEAEKLPAQTLEEEAYAQILQLLLEKMAAQKEESFAHYNEMMDYYTVWVHQIKTPIASMHLKLQNEDSALARSLQNDLMYIDQYVNMVLTYLRLHSTSTDYVIKETDLDQVIRPILRRFAGAFIAKKLTLDYAPPHVLVLTDEKWLSFVLEQLLSNAIKYTYKGGIKISLKEDQTLSIADTGIGIAKEDLPRIFENGYTGFNGRKDKRASGIGLFLCKRICQNLGHTLTIQSIPSKGTEVLLSLKEKSRYDKNVRF